MARTRVDGAQLKPDSVSKVETDITVVTTDGAAPFVADQSMGGHKLRSVDDPALAQDAATKAYADSAIAVAVAAVAATIKYYEPLTNGDGTTPELIFDDGGDVIMVEM